MNRFLLSPLTLLTLVLPACTSGGLNQSNGLTRYERVQAVKERPLSDDPDSPLHRMRAADGSAGMIIGTF